MHFYPLHWRAGLPMLMGHLQTIGGHLARTTTGPRHLAKCGGCDCCGSIEFASGTDIYSTSCGGWSGGGTDTVSGPVGAISVCTDPDGQDLGIVEFTREQSYSKTGEADRDCSIYEKWLVRAVAEESVFGLYCSIEYTLDAVTVSGSAPPNALDPAGCTYRQCDGHTLGAKLAFYTSYVGTGPFAFEWTPC